jgi:hypothetical protein
MGVIMNQNCRGSPHSETSAAPHEVTTIDDQNNETRITNLSFHYWHVYLSLRCLRHLFFCWGSPEFVSWIPDRANEILCDFTQSVSQTV